MIILYIATKSTLKPKMKKVVYPILFACLLFSGCKTNLSQKGILNGNPYSMEKT